MGRLTGWLKGKYRKIKESTQNANYGNTQSSTVAYLYKCETAAGSNAMV